MNAALADLYRHVGFHLPENVAAVSDGLALDAPATRGAPRSLTAEAVAAREELAWAERVPEGLDELERALEVDPRTVVREMQGAWDESVSEELVRATLARAREAVGAPERFVAEDRARLAALFTERIPHGFTFPAFDPAEDAALGLTPVANDVRFDPLDDALGWLMNGVGPVVWKASKAAFPRHQGAAGGFEYVLEEPARDQDLEMALFSDFGTGRFYSRYIAKQIRNARLPYAFHLGDVYYMGRQREFDEYFVREMEGLYPHTSLWMLNGNHEMYAGGKPYFRCIDDKGRRFPGVQRQEGSYFCLRSERFQIIGIDTDYEGRARIHEAQLAWLEDVLERGRRDGCLNILLSANEPYEYGRTEPARLWRTLWPLVRRELVDVWFWGNTHYCALFEPVPHSAPFVGSCVGHAGHPYERIRRTDLPTPAPLVFLETRGRFPDSTGLVQARSKGNSGYCVMSLRHDGTLGLRYVDWMGHVRCTARVSPGAAGGPPAVRLEWSEE